MRESKGEWEREGGMGKEGLKELGKERRRAVCGGREGGRGVEIEKEGGSE